MLLNAAAKPPPMRWVTPGWQSQKPLSYGLNSNFSAKTRTACGARARCDPAPGRVRALGFVYRDQGPVCGGGSRGLGFRPIEDGALAAMETKDKNALDDARRLLAECSLFRGLSADERNVLVARAHLRKFDAGDTIFL